jgi:glucan phosphoethanolaminetransferase (alkaline phosphatase superfamily)
MTLLGLYGTTIGLAFWLGSVVFFWFFVTPVMSKRLVPGKMAELNGVLNPRYYFLSYVCGLLMLIGAIQPIRYEKTRAFAIAFLSLTLLSLAISLYGGIVVSPRSQDLRERLQSSAGSDENLWIRDRFDHTNRLSIFLNGLVIVLLLGAAYCLSALVSDLIILP